MSVKKIRFNELVVVCCLGVILATLNLLHILLARAQTPPGSFYLWTGHYYLDYYVYLNVIKQGLMGSWAFENYFSSDDPAKTFLGWWPYLVLGKIGKLLNLSPTVVYWGSIFIFSIIFIIIIYYAINKLLTKLPFYSKILSLLIIFVAAPSFAYDFKNGIKFIPIDMWYSYNTFFKRLGVVPHHLISFILTLIILLFITKIFEEMLSYDLKKASIKAVITGFLLIVLLTFHPYHVITLLGVVLIMATIYGFKAYRFSSTNNKTVNYLIFILIIVFLVVPTALVINKIAGNSGIIIRSRLYDLSVQEHLPFLFILQDIGPLVIFIILGFFSYFYPFAFKSQRHIPNEALILEGQSDNISNPNSHLKATVGIYSRLIGTKSKQSGIKRISIVRNTFFLFAFVSYGLYASTINNNIGTFNQRFLSPINYIFFATIAVSGIISFASLLAKLKKFIIALLVFIFFLLCLPSNIIMYKAYLNDLNVKRYLPIEFLQGFSFLNSMKDKKNILTAPYGSFGALLPVFVDKKSYLARPIFTQNYDKKNSVVWRFYKAEMSNEEAKKFLDKNNISYVFWTALENFEAENLFKYHFLKPVFNNKIIIIWKNV